MNKKDEKLLMWEVAVLYYEKKHTQQEIAALMNLTRQTVSKLLGDAIKERVVEIRLHNPQQECEALQNELCRTFGLARCLVANVSANNHELRKTMTIKAAAEYLTDAVKTGNQKIALSWGRTIQEFISAMPQLHTAGNVVFPLFGATDSERAYFSSNELARSMADKIGADVKYAWFPYLPENADECARIKTLSYYKTMESLWNTADIAVLGIGNTDILEIFGKTFGYGKKHALAIGDIATHFFNESGEMLNLYENTLCASAESMGHVGQTVAVAFGDDKIAAICGALRTGMVNTLITDEYTARKVLEQK